MRPATDLAAYATDAALAAAIAALSGTYAPVRAGLSYTLEPSLVNVARNVFNANDALYMRPLGAKVTISKIAVHVVVQSGNISAAICSGPAGRNMPTTRDATTGAIPCPAAGYAELALGAPTEVDPNTDWYALSADNTTATFYGAAGDAGIASNLAMGFCGRQAAAHPVPANPAPAATLGPRSIVMVGVA